MLTILNNPYRTVGLLVGATAREQERQTKRLKQFMEAEQEPEDDFSFPALGKIVRTAESVTDAASKLNLDGDKMNAALFWFYNGNSITDEPAFDALKDGLIKEAAQIWGKHVENKEIAKKNASAFFNWSTLFLNSAFSKNLVVDGHLEKGISLKLKFLESDFIKDFKELATYETYKTTKKELQVIFLNQILVEIEKSNKINIDQFLKIIIKQVFSAKEDFLKDFVEKPIAQIEKLIEETRKKQNANPAKAGDYGNELYNNIEPLLTSIVSILGKTNIKVISVSDKVANEVLQCSINLFNHFHETGTEVGEIALDLNKKAKIIVLGSVVKERINESTPIVERYIRERPEREKLNKIKEEFEFIGNRLENFQSSNDTVNNANSLITICKPKLLKIKQAIGASDDFYINLSSSVVQNSQNMLVAAVNKKLEEHSASASLESLITEALDVSFKLGTFDMNAALKIHYQKNLDGIKSIANQIGISTLSPKEKLQNDLRRAEINLKDTQNTTFFKSEISNAKTEMDRIKEWQFLRSDSDREKQINAQQQKITTIERRSGTEKISQLNNKQKIVNDIKLKIQNAEY
ncbi:hypothetical protein EZJ43_00175 [Pedobacter changchengzhani]|uniref:Uncharacterized protein n=1 Tax=Pedobacter changchengzhani TaxID=2529274 RepID=A0A4R5MQM0_9SPHI|nr:hypothetical protein [Pedobacter changchengzhani]TDG37549.1 hypothetical protein EZJ43_00175 [Pedobacter changchengzhani]